MEGLTERCVTCLSDSKNSFATVDEKHLLEEFLNEKLPPVFDDFPVILCNNCSFQLEKFRIFKQSVKSSISTLSNRLNKIYGCRVFVQPLEITDEPVTHFIKEEKAEICNVDEETEANDSDNDNQSMHNFSEAEYEETQNSLKTEIISETPLDKNDDYDDSFDQWDRNFADPGDDNEENYELPKNSKRKEIEYSVEVIGGRTKVTTKSKGKITRWHQYIRKYSKKLPSRRMEGHKRSFKKLDTDCSVCKIKKLKSYRTHVVSNHAYEEDGKVFCADCKLQCSSNQALVYHFDIHRVFEEPKQCDECPDRLNNMKEYKRHVEAHRFSTKDFKCPECDNAYSHIASLQFHYMVIHTGALMCRFCRLVFELKEDYDLHMRAENLARREKKRLVRYTKIRLAKEKEKAEKLQKGIEAEEEESDFMTDLPMVFSRYITNVNGRKSTKFNIPKNLKLNQKIWCHICRIYTSTFQTHVTEKHATKLPSGEYMCNICNSCLRVSYSNHFSQMHREFPSVQKCDQCDFSSLRFEPLRKHLLNHKRGQFECHYCGSLYTEKTSLRYHMFFKHTSLFICPYCNKTFEEESVFKEHMTEEKAKRKGRRTVCDICGFSTVHQTYMKRHMTRVHGDSTDSVICNECGKKCKSIHNLKDHILNVHREKNEVCSQCGKRFRNQAYLQEHIKVSHSTIISKCPMCDKEGNPITLKRHMYMVHDIERPFACKICNMTFKIKAGLQKHLHTHAGTRPFNCHLCTKTKGFYNREVLEKHFIEVHKITFTRDELRQICKRMPSVYEKDHLGEKDEAIN